MCVFIIICQTQHPDIPVISRNTNIPRRSVHNRRMFLVLATLIATHTFIGKEYRHVSANCSQIISTQRISQLRPRRFFKHSCVQNVAVYIGVYSLVLYIGFWMLAIDGQTRQSLKDCRCLALSMYYRYIILYYFCTEFQYTLY